VPARGQLRPPLAFLILCDEWSTSRGGLSQFNRQLCIALAAAGHSVTCAVERADAVDDEHAAQHGVKLAVPTLSAGLIDLRAPLPGRPPFDAVIGHDRITGAAAAFQARNIEPASVLVQIVHTCPDETAAFAAVDARTTRAEERFNELSSLCSAADIVCSVGPRLTRKVGTMLDDGYGGQRVVRLDPGPGMIGTPRARIPGPEAICLFLGRAEHSAGKGIDIAADAVARVRRRSRHAANTVLWIRGAPPGRGDRTHADIAVRHGRGDLVVRDYTTSVTTVEGDLRRASVLLMPSRAEGFGLVGLEALSVGTPVLLSSRSGLSELIREVVGPDADDFIVEVRDDSTDVRRWASALEAILRDRSWAFRRTEVLAQALGKVCSWEAVADKLGRAVTEKVCQRL
jgi:hypothetical protein